MPKFISPFSFSLRDDRRSVEVRKYSQQILLLTRRLAGQNRHFQTVKTNIEAYFWPQFLFWKIYARVDIGPYIWLKFHFDLEPFTVSIFNGSKRQLKIRIPKKYLYV